MAPIALEPEDHSRDAAFSNALHGKADLNGGIRSMLSKDHSAHQAAVDEYFKHWDYKPAETETQEIREVCTNLCSGQSRIGVLTNSSGPQERIRHSHPTVSSSSLYMPHLAK